MSEPLPMERRRHSRTVLIRPCKLMDRRTQSYSAGQTSDISEGGALLTVSRERPFGLGDVVEVAVAWAGQSVVDERSLRPATIRRILPIDHHQQAIGVEYLHADEGRMADAA